MAVTDQGSTSNTGTTGISILADIAAGSLIAVLAGIESSSGEPGFDSCTDDAGNTYHAIGSFANGSNGSVTLFYCFNCKALSAGAVINPITSGSAETQAISVLSATGIQTSSDPLDVFNSATGTGTTPSVSFTTTNDNDLIICGMYAKKTNATTYTQASGYATPFAKDGLVSLGGMFIAGGNKIVSAAGSQTYNPTIGTSSAWVAIGASFKQASAASSNGNFFQFFN
jgi:hypothetical protein